MGNIVIIFYVFRMPDNMIFNGKQNILTKEQMNKLKIGVSVFNDDNFNPVLYRKNK